MTAPHRLVALSALHAVLVKSTAIDPAIASHPEAATLEPRDRGFAFAITMAAIRRLGSIDLVIEAMLDKPLPEQAIRARHILRCGTAELLILKTPPHAVVDSWTSIMGSEKSTIKFRGLCNAVLRRVAREGQTLLDDADPLLDLPDWICSRWIKTYGEDVVRAIARARADQPALDLTLKPGLDPEDWSKRLDAEILPTGSLRRSPTEVTSLEGYEDGAWWVQDAAAALPVKLLNSKQGEFVADVCAAPGGKTLQIAASAARTLSLDRSANRLKRVHDNLKRTGLNAEVITDDATRWVPETPLDAILLDAPCSATGTVRRNPETLWIKSEADIEKLAALQVRLLDHMADHLKPGGRLVYCTCSLEPEEGESQIADFLQRRPDYRTDPVKSGEIPELEKAITPEGWVRTRPDFWPERGGLDGFFIARLVRD